MNICIKYGGHRGILIPTLQTFTCKSRAAQEGDEAPHHQTRASKGGGRYTATRVKGPLNLKPLGIICKYLGAQE